MLSDYVGDTLNSTDAVSLISPAKARDEIASIAGTHFDVPVVADTYEIILTAAEQALRIPQDIKRRVGRWAYTWAMYTADSAPDPRVGVRGDVWVQSTPGRRRIFILGGQHGW